MLKIPVYALPREEDDSFVPLYFAKVRRGLQCLEYHDARRLRRLRQDVDRILVSHAEGTHFNPQFRMIVLYWKTVASVAPESIALSLVHEATHARHHAKGIEYRHDLQARLEESCVGQEAAFARHLPNGEELAAERIERLKTPWWTPEQLAERHRAQLRDLEAPKWVISIAVRLANRRQKAIEKRRAGISTGRP